MNPLTLALVASPSLLGSAQAFVPWVNTNGNGTNFDYFGGGSDNGLFGSPILLADTFRFFPSYFRAESTDGIRQQTHDRLQVELLAHAGERIDGVSFVNPWTYNVIGEGSSVTASVDFFVTDLNNFRVLHHSYVLPPGLTGSGEISGGSHVQPSVR